MRWYSIPSLLRMQTDSTKVYYAYMVECADGTLYSGFTTNLEKRVAVHNSGKGAKYTRSRLPVKLVYFEVFDSKQEAQRREWQLKQLTRSKKLELIEGTKKF